MGCIINSPVSADIPKQKFYDEFLRGTEDLASKIQPELILLSAGFDAHVNDPVGGLCLEEEDFGELTKLICQLADSHYDVKLVSLLEGGYHLEHLPNCVAEHFNELEAHERAAKKDA